MMPCVRPEKPAWYEENEGRWTTAWLERVERERRERDRAARFYWPELDNAPINHRLLSDGLGPMTQFHCAYCDAADLRATGHETIDHFRPKGRDAFRDLAFAWGNLYLACGGCQDEKGDDWHAGMLDPDGEDFRFERYFWYDVASGEIHVNEAASDADRARASATIELVGLNRRGRPGARRRALRTQREEPPNERPYRFVF